MVRRRLRGRACAIVLGALLACEAMAQASAPAPARGSLESTGIDPAISPRDDFYRAANGGWIRDAPIPPWVNEAAAVTQLRDATRARQRRQLDQLAAAPPPTNPELRALRDFWSSYMDVAAIERAGLAPVEPSLREVRAANDPQAVAALLLRWQGLPRFPLELSSATDRVWPGFVGARVRAGDFVFGPASWWIGHDDVRRSYERYARELLALVGDDDPAAHAAQATALVAKLAQAGDASTRSKSMSLQQLSALAPAIDWSAWFDFANLRKDATMEVENPERVGAVAALLAHEPVAAWRAYLIVARLDAVARELPEAVRKIFLDFHSRLMGVPLADYERWRDAMVAIDDALPATVGRYYVAGYVPEADKRGAEALAEHVRTEFAIALDHAEWMAPATRAEAREKLARIAFQIGYREPGDAVAPPVIRAGDALGNRDRATAARVQAAMARVGQPIDRSRWLSEPWEIWSYYNVEVNALVVPAAMLQPPFFDRQADAATNYGSFGALVGSLLVRAVVGWGSRYDADGRPRTWWTSDDRRRYDALVAPVARQYSAFVLPNGTHVDGVRTLNEDVCHILGLQLAYDAYARSLEGRPAPVLDGQSGDQRFFYAWARPYRFKVRPGWTSTLLDPEQAPEFAIVNGAVVHLPAFHAAFGTQPGDKLWLAPDLRLKLWN